MSTEELVATNLGWVCLKRAGRGGGARKDQAIARCVCTKSAHDTVCPRLRGVVSVVRWPPSRPQTLQ